jgi:hypothetical protein
VDELTQERFGPGVPAAEARRKPRPLKVRTETPPEVIEQRRAILNGDDEDERRTALGADLQLAEVIRRWVA